MPRGYEAVLWVIRDSKPKQRGGMQDPNLGPVTEFAFAVSQFMLTDAKETGFVTVTDYSTGTELIRIDFKKEVVLAAAAAS